jgi:hypothetical protein
MQRYKLINRGRGMYHKYPRLLDFGRGSYQKYSIYQACGDDRY